MKSARLHLIVSAILALAAIAAYGAWYMFVQQGSQETATLSNELAGKEATHAHAQVSKGQEVVLADKQAFTATHLLATADAVSFLERLEGTGRTLGAKVSVASVDDAHKDSGSLDISLSISGSFDAVMRTLGAIEHGQPAAVAKSMTLSGGGATWSASGVITVATQTP